MNINVGVDWTLYPRLRAFSKSSQANYDEFKLCLADIVKQALEDSGVRIATVDLSKCIALDSATKPEKS